MYVYSKFKMECVLDHQSKTVEANQKADINHGTIIHLAKKIQKLAAKRKLLELLKKEKVGTTGIEVEAL